MKEPNLSQNRLALLESAIAAAPFSAMITNAGGVIEWVNPAFTWISGYDADEVVGKNSNILKSGKHPSEFYERLWLTIRSGRSWRGVIINRRKDGRLFAEDMTISPIRGEEGEITHYVAIKIDISDRREAEQSQAKLAAIIENTTDFVGQADLEGRVSYCNPGGLRLVGYQSLADIFGRSIEEFLSADSVKRIKEEGIPTAISNGAWHGEGELRARDGTLIPVSQTILAGRENGEVTHTTAIMRDLSELRSSQAQLVEQAEIIDKVPFAVIIADLSHCVTYCNDFACRLYGMPREKLIGITAEEVFAEESLAEFKEARVTALEKGGWMGEMQLVTRSGNRFDAEIQMSLIRDDSGNPKARLNITRDVTESRRLKEQYLRAQRLESIGMLAAGIAHDLNNILAPILMGVPLLRDRLSEASDIRLIDLIGSSAQRGAGVVRQILGFSQGISGEQKEVQLKHVLRDIAQIVRQTFPKSIEFEDSIPSDLGGVIGNTTQIHQVFLNLCVNARDAMPNGGRLKLNARKEILDSEEAARIAGASAGPWAVVEVADSGTGIPPELVERIWEPFFTTKSIGKGTGLGLSTVSGIVKEHHGFVTLDTKVGGGTRFVVYLPVSQSREAQESIDPIFPRGAGERILVVDDEQAICDLIEDILESFGFVVTTANDGVQGVANFVRKNPGFNLVITDLAMPNLDGIGMAKVIRRLAPEVPILGISGLDQASKKLVQDRQVADDFLAKPFRHKDLLRKVSQLLQPGSP